MRIIFKRVRYRNFLASGNDWVEIQLDKHSNTLITGDNGAGKSSMIDAITFALFKRAFRNTNKPLLVNTINKANALIELEFEIGTKEYKIVRGIKPDKFEIYENGKLKNQEGVIDYQRALENILGFNFKTFSQIIVLSNTNKKVNVPFMELPALDRRNIIENLLDITIFSEMSKINKDKLNVCNERIDSLKLQIKNTKDKITIHEKNIKDIKQDKQSLVDNNLVEIVRLQDNFDALEQQNLNIHIEIANLTKSISHKDETKTKEKELNNLNIKIYTNLNSTTKDIKFFNEHDHCPTCNQDIDSVFKLAHVDKLTQKRESLQHGIKRLETELDVTKKTIEEIGVVLDKIGELNKTIYQNQVTITQNKTWISKLQTENINLLQKKSDLDDENQELKSLNIDVENLTKEYAGCLDDRLYLEKAVKMLKDDGIKTIIIKQYLPIINKSINKYLSYMDFFVNFSLNEEFEESIKSRYIDEFSYGNFSEGQKMRINMAILFSWIHLAKLKNSIDTNLLIMDETLDSALDPQGTEECLKLIQNFSKDTNIFVLSPKPDQFLDKFENVIRFRLKGNFSEVVV